MLKLIILGGYMTIAIVEAFGQTLETHNTGSAGGFVTANSAQLQFNIGESVIFQSDQLTAGIIQSVDLTTLTDETQFADKFLLRPNPCTSYIEVDHKLDVRQWVITNQSGQIINRISHAEQTFRINTERLDAGQYYLIPIQDTKPLFAMPFIKINY